MIDLKPENPYTAAWWDDQYIGNKAQGWTIWKDYRLLDHAAKVLPKFAHVLLLASGVGHAAVQLQTRRIDLRWTFCDYSAIALEGARSNYPPVLNCIEHDLNSVPWPFADNAFDAVIVSEILEHVAAPRLVLQEACRVAKFRLVTMPRGKELLSEGHMWQFETPDCFRFIPQCKKMHMLQEGKLLLAISYQA